MKRVAVMLAAVAIGAFASQAQAATTFNFSFDHQALVPGDGPLSPPIVGTGTFVSPVDLSLGLHNLTDLAGFTVNFSFSNGDTFSTADITTPLTGVALNITDLGGGIQRLFFTESGGTGTDGGPLQGAIDFAHGASFLSFEPSYSGGNYFYYNSDGFGRYLAVSSPAVPEPATWAMMLVGFGFVGGAMRSAKRRQKAAISNA